MDVEKFDSDLSAFIEEMNDEDIIYVVNWTAIITFFTLAFACMAAGLVTSAFPNILPHWIQIAAIIGEFVMVVLAVLFLQFRLFKRRVTRRE